MEHRSLWDRSLVNTAPQEISLLPSAGSWKREIHPFSAKESWNTKSPVAKPLPSLVRAHHWQLQTCVWFSMFHFTNKLISLTCRNCQDMLAKWPFGVYIFSDMPSILSIPSNSIKNGYKLRGYRPNRQWSWTYLQIRIPGNLWNAGLTHFAPTKLPSAARWLEKISRWGSV